MPKAVEYDRNGRPLTIDHRLATIESMRRNPELRTAILAEGLQCLLNGEADLGRAIVHDCIEANIGLAQLSEQTGQSLKDLTLMFTKGGNPKIQNFLEAITQIRRQENILFQVNPVPQEKVNGRRRYTRTRQPKP